MSCLIAPIVSAAACCCGSAFCSLLCCRCCPTYTSSVVTRIIYGLFLLIGIGVGSIFLIPSLRNDLEKIPFICKGYKVVNPVLSAEKCHSLVSFLSFYRVCFGLAALFFLMSIITIAVSNSQSVRGKFHNGFWGIKIIICVAITVAAFYIPGGDFERVWVGFSMSGAFLFILVQMVLLVDFAHRWCESWLEKHAESDHNGWMVALSVVTFVFFSLAIVCFSLLIVYYTGSKKYDCVQQKVLIGTSFLSCIVVTVVSILPAVQEASSSSGIFQGFLMSVYISYLTWTALSSSTDSVCNPFLGASAKAGLATSDIVSFILLFIALLYGAISCSSTGNMQRLTGRDGKPRTERTAGGDEKIVEDEDEEVSYSYSWFHMMMVTCVMYCMMFVTKWNVPDHISKTLVPANNALWVKMGACWTSIVLYLWTLLAPILVTWRDFS